MTMPLDRRAFLTATGMMLALPALGQGDDGFQVTWQDGAQSPAVEKSLAEQIALVKALHIKPDIAAFFAAQPITVVTDPTIHTRAGPRGVFLEAKAVPAENPVLLHELLHRYHLLRLPQGWKNPMILAFYEAAKEQGYPPNAYMLKNAVEFFAMTASVVLYGRAARPPFVRENVRAKSPELYAWIVKEFGLEL